MIDIIQPKQNSLEEFLALGEQLKLKGFYILGKAPFPQQHKLQLYSAGLLQIAGKDIRNAVERGAVDIVTNLELEQRKDFSHSRNSGLNQVLCKLIQKRKAIVVFNFSAVLQAKGFERARIMGRMQQNVQLCRKYKIPMAIATFAQEPFQLRNPKDLQAFCFTLGMHPGEAQHAINAIEERIAHNLKRKAGIISKEGIIRLS